MGKSSGGLGLAGACPPCAQRLPSGKRRANAAAATSYRHCARRTQAGRLRSRSRTNALQQPAVVRHRHAWLMTAASGTPAGAPAPCSMKYERTLACRDRRRTVRPDSRFCRGKRTWQKARTAWLRADAVVEKANKGPVPATTMMDMTC